MPTIPSTVVPVMAANESRAGEIVAIEITHHQLPLDPPFPASWDQSRGPVPTTLFGSRTLAAKASAPAM